MKDIASYTEAKKALDAVRTTAASAKGEISTLNASLAEFTRLMGDYYKGTAQARKISQEQAKAEAAEEKRRYLKDLDDKLQAEKRNASQLATINSTARKELKERLREPLRSERMQQEHSIKEFSQGRLTPEQLKERMNSARVNVAQGRLDVFNTFQEEASKAGLSSKFSDKTKQMFEDKKAQLEDALYTAKIAQSRGEGALKIKARSAEDKSNQELKAMELQTEYQNKVNSFREIKRTSLEKAKTENISDDGLKIKKTELAIDFARSKTTELSALIWKYTGVISNSKINTLLSKLISENEKLSNLEEKKITDQIALNNKAARQAKKDSDAKKKKASDLKKEEQAELREAYRADLAAAMIPPIKGDSKAVAAKQVVELEKLLDAYKDALSKETESKLKARINSAKRRASASTSESGKSEPAFMDEFRTARHQAIWQPIKENEKIAQKDLAKKQAEGLQSVFDKFKDQLSTSQRLKLEEEINRKKREYTLQSNQVEKPKKPKSQEEMINSGLTFLSYSQFVSALDAFSLKMLEAATAMEQFRRRIDIVIHNRTQADSYFEFLKQYEKQTPYDINQVMAAGVAFAAQENTIQQSGLGKESAVRLAGELGSINPSAGIIEAQRALSRVAAADPNGLEILRSQFAITNETLRQFGAERVLTSTGVSLRSVQNRQLVIEAIDKYVNYVTQGKGTLGQSQTLQGRLSTLGSQATQTAGAIFEPMIPALTKLVTVLTSFLEKIASLDSASKTLIGTFTLVTLGLSSFAKAMLALEWLLKSTPLEGGLAALGGKAVTAFDSFVTKKSFAREVAETAAGVGAEHAAEAAAKETAKRMGGKAAKEATEGITEGIVEGAIDGAADANKGPLRKGIDSIKAMASRISPTFALAIGAIVVGFGTLFGLAQKRLENVIKKQEIQGDMDMYTLSGGEEYVVKGQYGQLYPKRRIGSKFGEKVFDISMEANSNEGETKFQRDLIYFSQTRDNKYMDQRAGEYDAKKKVLQRDLDMFKTQHKYELANLQNLPQEKREKLEGELKQKESALGKIMSFADRLRGKGPPVDMQQLAKDVELAKLRQTTVGEWNPQAEWGMLAQSAQYKELQMRRDRGTLSFQDAEDIAKIENQMANLAEDTTKLSKALDDVNFGLKEAGRNATWTDQLNKAANDVSRIMIKGEASQAEQIAARAQQVQKQKQFEDEMYKQRVDQLRRFEGETVSSLAKLTREEQQAVRPFADNYVLKTRIHEEFERQRYTLTDNNLRKLADLERTHRMSMIKLQKQAIDMELAVINDKRKDITYNDSRQNPLALESENPKLDALDTEELTLKGKRTQQDIKEIKESAAKDIAELEKLLDTKRTDAVVGFDRKAYDARYKATKASYLAEYQEISRQNRGRSGNVLNDEKEKKLQEDYNKKIADLEVQYQRGLTRKNMAEMGQLEPEKIRQNIEDLKKKRDSDINEAKNKFRLEEKETLREKENRGIQKKLEADKVSRSGTIETLEMFKERLEYNAENDPNKSRFARIEALKQQFEIEKQIIDLKKQEALADPTLTKQKAYVIEQKALNDIVKLQDQYKKKLEEQTEEMEAQKRLRELEEEYYNKDKAKHGFNAGFSMGEMFGIEDLNKNIAMDSEYFRLKAGFGREKGEQPKVYPGYGPKIFPGYGSSTYNPFSADPRLDVDPRKIPGMTPTSPRITAKEVYEASTKNRPGIFEGSYESSGKWKMTQPSLVPSLDINVVVKTEDGNVVGKEKKRFGSAELYTPNTSNFLRK